MSAPPTSPSDDLQRLLHDGYALEQRGAHLLVHDIPYVTADRQVARGVLVCPLDLNNDVTLPPSTHVMWFIGSRPHRANGTPMTSLDHAEQQQNLGGGIVVDRSFSRSPSAAAATRTSTRRSPSTPRSCRRRRSSSTLR